MTADAAHPRRRRRDADANLDTLLETATRVLGEDPNATMAEIVAASGLGRVTAWRHVGSREQLLALLLERASAEVREALDAVLADAVATPELLGRAVDALRTVIARHRVLFAVQPAHELHRERRAALAPLERAIRRGQRAGSLRSGIPAEVAASLLAAMTQTAVQESASARTMRQIRRFVESGMAPEAAQA